MLALGTITKLSKKIEVLLPHGSKYHTSVDDAWVMVRKNYAVWDNHKQIRVLGDESKRGLWEKRQSGEAGPMVLQLT